MTGDATHIGWRDLAELFTRDEKLEQRESLCCGAWSAIYKGISSRRFFRCGGFSLFLFGAACTLSVTATSPAPSPSASTPKAAKTHQVASEAPQAPQTPQPEEPEAANEQESLDAWSLAAREDGDACRSALTEAKVRFQKMPDNKTPDKSGCGIPHPVVVLRGPTSIAYDPPITVDCSFARSLIAVERIVQEEAATHLHSRIAKIGNLGAFACRPRNFRKGGALSAHAFGSALDVVSFHPASGAPAVVLQDYEELPPTRKSSASREMRRAFLRATLLRLRREGDLTYAIGPDFNATHKNHFHLDRGGWYFWFHR